MLSARVVGYCERNTDIDPPRVIIVAANTSVIVLPAEPNSGEIAARYIQNVGANPLYYSWGMYIKVGTVITPVVNAVDAFHGYLAAGQQLDCSSHRRIVCVYSTLGTTVSTTTVRRNDMAHHN